ncbi:MAG: hypothetical protein ACFE0Q_13070 [Anaerolineae bacterium]
MTQAKRFQVIDGPLSVREAPDGKRISVSLAQGEEVTRTAAEPVQQGGYLWIQHEYGWSALSPADQSEIYLLDISDRDPNAPRRFRVWSTWLSVRDSANGKRLPTRLSRGLELDVKPDSRTEAGGYIWWQHEHGWSAERNIIGNQIFLKEIFASPATMPIPESQKARIPDTWQGKMALQVGQAVKVRAKPGTDPRGLILRTIPRGQVLLCDMDTLTEADNYYWVRHEHGWSAIQSVNGKIVFLVEPGTIPGLIAIGPDGPVPQDLPEYRALFTRLPVNLNDIQWFQYFGNNMYAMRKGQSFGYDRYSQGLHGGLDFGNSQAPKPIFAGLEAEFVKIEYPSRNNTRIHLKQGDYTIIYQHITNARRFSAGDPILPDTQLGIIEHHSINNGWDHLHLEVRFMKSWIVNPLLLFIPEIYEQLTARFDPNKANTSYKYDFPKSSNNFFYHTPDWERWVTPLDQPMIKLAGAVIGPRAELDQSEW